MFRRSLNLKVLSLSVTTLVAAGAGTLVWRATRRVSDRPLPPAARIVA